MEISGRKTTIGVIVEPTSGARISRMALEMASARDWPLSRCMTMFSTTTMASSITRPTAAPRPQRRAPIAQEQHHDQRSQCQADQDGVAYAGDGIRDDFRLIVVRAQVDALGQFLVDALDLGVHRAGHHHGIAVRLPVDVE